MSGDKYDGHENQALVRIGLAIFFTMNVMVFTMALWAWDLYEIPDSTNVRVLRELLRYACLFFAAPVLLLLGGPLLVSALATTRRRLLSTDLLLVVGVGASFAYSVFAIWRQQPHVYFEVGCMILVAVTIGRWLEATGKQKASDCLKAMGRLIPESARRLTPDGEETVPVGAIRPGDLLRIETFQRVPVDGIVERRAVVIDTQVMTGESEPKDHAIGALVYGGTLNLQHELFLRASATSSDGTIQRLMNSVAEAAQGQSNYQRHADRLATVLGPAMVSTAVATLVVRLSAGGGHDAVSAALSVLLISCPCAMGIATPLAIWAAMTVAARHRVLFRDGDAISKLASVRAVAFDKTGTLTLGQLSVHDCCYADGVKRRYADAVAARLAGASSHQLSRSLVTHLQRSQLTAVSDTIESVTDHPGRGVTGIWQSNGRPVLMGSLEFAIQRGFRVPQVLHDRVGSPENGPQVVVAWNQRIRAVYCFEEVLRPESRAAVDALRQRNRLHLEIITGDSDQRGRWLAHHLGLDVRANALPNDKLDRIRQLQNQHGCVAMVGDGVNDVPALAAADVGVALGCGADVSRDVADVCLIGNSLEQLPWAIQLSKSANRTIKFNLFWACAYNVVGAGLAVSGLLTPIVAAIAMVGSSLFVVSNSLRFASTDPDVDSAGGQQRRADEASANQLPSTVCESLAG